MALDPEKAEGIPRKLIGIYNATELQLLNTLADAITKGIDTPDWYANQPAEMLRFRNQAQRLANGLNATTPNLITTAATDAVKFGRDAVDEDINLAGHLTTKSGRPAGLTTTLTVAQAKLAQKAATDGINTLTTINQQLPNAATSLYQQVTARVNATSASSDATRRQAVQQALNVLTARGITGFRDNAGRNWSLSTYVEMKSRTLVNNTLMQAHIDTMLERGLDLVVVSSHPRPAPQCQPFEGQVLSIGDTRAGTTIRPNATGGAPVRVRVKATMDEARARGFRHPNCRHSIAAYIPGASRTFTTNPDPDGYAATQKQRAMERAIRDTKRRQAVTIDPAVKKRLNGTLRSQQESLKRHIAVNDLKRRTLRERPDYGYKIDPPAGSNRTTIPTPPAPTPVDLGAAAKLRDDTTRWLTAEAAYRADVKAWLDAEKAYKATQPARTLTEKQGRAYGKKVWLDYANTITPEQLAAVRYYTGNGYEDVNEYLRDDRPEPGVPEKVAAIDALIENAPRVPERITVGRTLVETVFGITKRPENGDPTTRNTQRQDDIDALIGQTFRDEGFMSTALQSDGFYLNRYEAKLVIDVPPGTKGVYVSGHDDDDPRSLAEFGPEENELLLGRGVEYEVTDVALDPATSDITIYLRVTGQNPTKVVDR